MPTNYIEECRIAGAHWLYDGATDGYKYANGPYSTAWYTNLESAAKAYYDLFLRDEQSNQYVVLCENSGAKSELNVLAELYRYVSKTHVGLWCKTKEEAAEEYWKTYKTPVPTGVKYDEEKPRPSLVINGFALALYEVARVATYGAKKYTDNGWTEVVNGHARYTDAMLRHILAEGAGQALDKESGLDHDAMVAWNALARLELRLRANTQGS